MKTVTTEAIRKELDDLVGESQKLYYRLALDSGALDEDGSLSKKENEERKEQRKALKELLGDYGRFNEKYQGFYTQAIRIVRTIAPERLDDFCIQYRDGKRKKARNYDIHDIGRNSRNLQRIWLIWTGVSPI